MKLMNVGLLIGALALSSAAVAGEGQHKAAATHAGLEKLKGLSGDWETVGGDGSTSVTYRVTAGGSAVMETLFPGSPHEMVTMYHLEGRDLVLTHYCAAQNQPKMKADAGSAEGTLQFAFAGGANINPKKDGHMHEMTMKFVDADTLHAEWTYYNEGKKGETKSFDLKRKKS